MHRHKLLNHNVLSCYMYLGWVSHYGRPVRTSETSSGLLSRRVFPPVLLYHICVSNQCENKGTTRVSQLPTIPWTPRQGVCHVVILSTRTTGDSDLGWRWHATKVACERSEPVGGVT